MKFRHVKSSNINELGHQGDTLGVRFKNGSEYHYSNVPESIFNRLIKAASIGRTFNELIKSHPSEYPYHQVA